MYRLVVHGSHLLQFARAIGDPEPAYTDVDRLTVSGPDALVAPPTFLMAADHFDPAYARRPRPGVAWIASRRREPDQQAGFHMEQHFTFHRPVRAGDVLTADDRPGDTWRKSGRRAGTMTFSETLTDYRDADGALVATARWVQAMVEHTPPVAADPVAQPNPSPTAESEGVDDGDDGDLVVGSAWSVPLVADLTRAQIVMYAGASGDFHPLHSDDVYARERGYPGVFAHGMLTMGMSGRAVTDRFGHANVRSFGGRISSQVWPGDTLTARVEVTGRRAEDGAALLDLAVATVNQHGVRVFDGAATVRVS
ncbi:MaoC family dehydratase N-terminal domain-containing protein [Rhodococcus sp. TAF43]|uniref:FAS1-like dehydratase domain-containing protein n=1 Tax=unclassified Rhodococcus (in: high G+C Gram-positive bacteria) TaxID=192944 RepID=UPI001581844C|nr:MaoC family dehydratase N-terminal domain-containing protein [Rhodococcus sp. W8901]QKT10413.1 MaoC family dehydratase N-terminal domain-containing protein [Rhodococcus sp. W8901]